MNSRVKILFGLVVLVGLSQYPSLTRADVPTWNENLIQNAEIQHASSGQGDVLSSYPFFLNRIMTFLFGWDPTLEHKNSSFEPLDMIRILTVQFDVSDTNHFRKVWFPLRPGLQVRGLLALHDFKQARPLVILRMGIHGNVDELLAERFLFKALYENLKVNVLVLESLTSHSFLKTNAEVSFGGTEEGLHTFLILQNLISIKSSISQLISTVHLLGVSLGAQGVFLTTLLDQSNSNRVVAQMNLCPLINLKETFEHHAKPSLKNVGIDLWNILRLRAVRAKKDFKFYWFDYAIHLMSFKPYYTPSILAYLNTHRAKPLLSVSDIEAKVPGLKWPEGLKNHLENSNDFYSLNHFWPYYKGVSTPTTILTTPNDLLVKNELNADLIFSKQQAGDFSSLSYKKLDRGLHCGFPPVYAWTEIVSWLKLGLKL